MKKIDFDYGVIAYKHRFDIDRPLSDYKEVVLDKCISVKIEYIFKFGKLVPEIQILYNDKNNKTQCLCLDLRDWTFKVLHQGMMMIVI